MTEKNNIHTDDEQIRQLIQSAKRQAPENLKYRIMQQIETESALSRKTVPAKKREGNVLREFIGVFGVMYAVLAAFIGGAYVLKGKDFLLSPTFFGTVILVAFVFSFFWLMTRVDARVREKRKGKEV